MKNETKQKRAPRWEHPHLTPKFDRLAKRRGGIKVQGYGFAADGRTVVCAGVHFVPEISARFIWGIGQHLKRWRRWYDKQPQNQIPGHVPREFPQLGVYGITPIGDESAQSIKWLQV